jgi:hypothetical protein
LELPANVKNRVPNAIAIIIVRMDIPPRLFTVFMEAVQVTAKSG